MDKDLQRVSKRMAYHLRHNAGMVDYQGYAQVSVLLAKLRETTPDLTRSQLDQIVREDPKGRYAYDSTRQRIRATQGHSVPVDVGLREIEPPELLYHGTATRFMDAIFRQGLNGQSRLYVHLSRDPETARSVGARHGKPVVLLVRAGEMHRDGFPFLQAENGVILTKTVPPGYFEISAEPT